MSEGSLMGMGCWVGVTTFEFVSASFLYASCIKGTFFSSGTRKRVILWIGILFGLSFVS